MRKWILIFFTLFIWQQAVQSQDVVGCTQLLEDAREAYSAGMVELVPDLLLPCLETDGLTGSPRQDAYKLVINAYLFDYLPEEADSLMDKFVRDFPDYRSMDSDPAEFSILLEAHLVAGGIDPDEVVVEEENVVPDRSDNESIPDNRARLKIPFVYENSMGFVLGLNGTFPQIIERYSIGDPTVDQGSYSIAPGLQVGVTMNLILSQAIETSFGLQFNRTRFNFESTPLSFASYVYNEYQSHLQLPASMIFKLNPETAGASVYLRIGVVADYLLSASGGGTRSYTASLKDVELEKVPITDSRAKLNLHGMAGTGIRFPLEDSFVFMEARFASGLFQINRPENRYENQDITWLLYHVDSDFRSHQFSFIAGIAWNL